MKRVFSTLRTLHYCYYFYITSYKKHTFTPQSVDNRLRIEFL